MSEPATGRSVEAQLMDSMFKEKLLSEKIAAANAENSVLKTKIDEINTEAEQSQSKQGDLIWFYRKENEQKDKVIANLTQTNQKLELLIRELKENKDDELKRMESQNAAVRKELQEHLEKLTRESKSLKEFREQKRELEMELTQLKATIENENKEMIKKVNDLERLNVAEKERLKKEMLKKIKETKLSLLAMTEDQLHTTTKRAIMENEQMAIELQYQSKETERLLAKNAKLIKEKLALKRELELHKETEAILAKRTSFFQKLIKKLHTKSKANDRKINEFEASQRANARANASNMFVENQVIRQLEAQLENSEMARRASDAECDLARSQCQQARQTLNQFLDLQDESITFIWTEIEHVRNEVKKCKCRFSLKWLLFFPLKRLSDGGTLKTLNEDERHLLLCKLHARLQKLKESFAHQMYSVFEDIQPSIHMNEPHDETNADNANFQETHNPYKRDGLLQT